MKRILIISSLLSFLGFQFSHAQSVDDFVTIWKTDNSGPSSSTSITIPTFSTAIYSYDVDWNNDGTFDEFGITGDVTHDFGTAGTYTIRIQGTFPRIYFNDEGDRQKLISVNQWGNIAWTSMSGAFSGCSNMVVNASDAPDLSGTTSMNAMFSGCSTLNQDINHWDVSTITDMGFLFREATSFDQPLNLWNVGNVLYMPDMFAGCSEFNQDIGGWNVANVKYIGFMFYNCSKFNQNLGNWNVSNVESMYGTFSNCTVFNQDISAWNTEKVNDMNNMFESATAFNQAIGGWDVAKVERMEYMFQNAVNFNQAIGGWDVSLANDMSNMFNGATSFNQDISGWDVSSVNDFSSMFSGATSFDQNLGGWDMVGVYDVAGMFYGVTLSTDNYDALLIGWSAQNLNNNLSFSAGNSKYCAGAIGRQTIIDNFNWSISDGGYDLSCSTPDQFVTTWKTDNPGSSGNTSITIPTTGSGYFYFVDWGDGTISNGVSGNITHSYSAAGTYTVKIQGDFPRIYFNDEGDRQKLISVDQWGNIAWTSMSGAFSGCSNMVVNASDAPDLSGATSMNAMFSGCSTLNQDINHWDVSTITDMGFLFREAITFDQPLNLWNVGNVLYMPDMFAGCSEFNQAIGGWNVANVKYIGFMFYNCSKFNQNIGNWNVSNVESMYGTFSNCPVFNQDISAWNTGNVDDMNNMFENASAFNQAIGGWDVAKVERMEYMFQNAVNFNQAIGGWDVSLVKDMSNMFNGATSFNQDISGWDVSSVNDFSSMFSGATSFDQNLGGWDMVGVYDVAGMFYGVTLSTDNYDALLIGWSAQNLNNNLSFSAGNSKYCAGAMDRQTIIDNFNWSISDGGYDLSCSTPDQFVTTWKTDNPGSSGNTSITIPTTGSGYFYFVDWGDGTISNGVTGNITHNYPASGTYTVKIQGDFPRIYFNNGGDSQKLLSVDQWGNIAWTSMEGAFSGCSNLVVNATDEPDLSGATSMNAMFTSCSTLNQDINHWDVSTITDMSGLFQFASSFDQPLNLWNVGNVQDMSSMFKFCTLFNQPLNSWDVSNVQNMNRMFADAEIYDQALNSWDVGNVTDMHGMFEYLINFDQALNNWNVSNVTDMGNMFAACATFDKNLSNWDVSSVTDMSYMFGYAISFNQNLGSWDVASVTDMTGMFSGVNLSLSNYDALLIGWSALSLQANVPFDAGFSQYCAGATERQSMIDTYNWTITDNGYTNSCLSDQFVTTWKTDNTGYSGPTSINITTHPSESYNYDVDWNNDGVFEDLNVTGDIIHNYGVAGTYTIRIRGTYPRIFFSTPYADLQKILSVDQWGSTAWTSMNLAFEDCSNLQILASDNPNLSVATDLSFMFQHCTSMNENIDAWDVSNITNMKGMFVYAGSFNQPLNSWDVSNVNNMEQMFSGAENFNQALNNWNVGNVTNMVQMFASAINFNQALNSWDVSNVNNMVQMFSGAENFNQALNNWNVASVQNMFSMFAFAFAFDQNLGNWNVASVTNMTSMFSDATLSTANYDALIIGWSAQSLQSNLTFDGGNSQYCTATTERQQLIDNFNWTITDGGYDFSCDPSAHFITTWKTDNPGSSGDQTISIPVDPGNTYYYSIDWGDGAEEHELTGTASHTYASSGTYTVKIQGLYPRIYFFNSGDREKLLTVSQWGSQSWISMESAFKNCNNLTIPATDAPDLSGVSNMDEMFENCSSFNNDISNWDVSNVSLMNKLFQNATAFNQPLNSWNVSNVTEMSLLFYGASSFNQPLNNWNVGNVIYMFATFSNATSFDQPLGNWNVSNVEEMGAMFDQVTLSTANYDDLLIGWGALSLQSNVFFIAGFSTYCDGEQARQDIINNYGWSISDGGKDCLTDHFVTTWITDNPGTSGSTSITIPTSSVETYNYDVDWNNDGIFDDLGVTGNITHDFGTIGTYTIRIRGTFPKIHFLFAGDREKIIAVEQWGSQVWTSMYAAFHLCYNLTIPATDAPDLSQVTSTEIMFYNCTSFNQSINHWDVSNVTEMVSMFYGCTSFNQSLNLWDVSNAQNLLNLFIGCSSFNQDLSNWDVGNVTAMGGMFRDCISFNQDIGNWNTSNVMNMHSMFLNCSAFDQNIGNWDISNVTSAQNMFSGTALSVDNYDDLLIGWNTLDAGETQIPTGLDFNAGVSTYCDGEVARTSLIDIYGWTITDGGMEPTCLALPVELSDFTGKAQTTYNQLVWSTASEFNSGFYEIERSESGRDDWTRIGTVQAAGNSSTRQDYQFDDTAPPAQAYYRLRMVDLDGSFSYSNIISLENSQHTQNMVNVYPNPAGDFLYIQWTDAASYEAFLYDASGQLVLNSNNPGRLELAGLPAGLYLLQLRDMDSGKEVKKRVVRAW